MIKTVKYSELEPRLGDFIFTLRREEAVSTIISKLTHSKVSHVACVKDKDTVIEAIGTKGIGKVREYSIKSMVEEEGIELYIAVPKPYLPTIIDDAEYLKWLESTKGIKYDYKNIFTTQLTKIIFNRVLFGKYKTKDKADDEYICSELGADAMNRRYGILDRWYKTQPTPQQLFELNKYFNYYKIII